MRRVQRLLRSADRVQQRSRWLGFPLAVMRKFADDHGGALTTVIAYNAFFALFPLLLVVLTFLGFLSTQPAAASTRCVPCCWLRSLSSCSCWAATPSSSSASSVRRWLSAPSSATR